MFTWGALWAGVVNVNTLPCGAKAGWAGRPGWKAGLEAGKTLGWKVG